MEKRTPHYSLALLQKLVAAGSFRVTVSARRTAYADFQLWELDEIAACVLSLTNKDFYKSMTALADSHLWQDVYRPKLHGVAAYLKVQVVDELGVVISLKRLE